jgi:hypothetical protein
LSQIRKFIWTKLAFSFNLISATERIDRTNILTGNNQKDELQIFELLDSYRTVEKYQQNVNMFNEESEMLIRK